MSSDRRIFVISDTHFGHRNIIKYCNRPFADTDEMDEAIVRNWNEVVRPQDIVYHLGDVYFKMKEPSFLRRLMGRKRLLLGNHDSGKDSILQACFQKIGVWRMFPEYGVVLTHIPIHMGIEHAEERAEKYDLNVHGHIHDQDPPTNKHINVSVERIDYRPVELETLVNQHRRRYG